MDVLGTYPPPMVGHQYMWAVLRPSLILGALQLMSWSYQHPHHDQAAPVAASVDASLPSTSRQPGPVHSAPPTNAAPKASQLLRQQQSWAWFLRRLVVLHIDKGLVLLVFVALLKVRFRGRWA
jgi:hypothetical protein